MISAPKSIAGRQGSETNTTGTVYEPPLISVAAVAARPTTIGP
jgi:hypothetical protein